MTKEEAIVAMVQGKLIISDGFVYKYFNGKFCLNNSIINVNHIDNDGFEFYEEPKKKVKKCLWIVKNKRFNTIRVTENFFNIDAPVYPCPDEEIIGPALWSEIEVDE